MSERRLRGLSKAFLDPVVIAAVLAAAGGTVTVLTQLRESNAFTRIEKQCDRAFAFLQDETVGPRLRVDEAFNRVQRDVALRCSRGRTE